jgi:hypothetical protein
VYETEEHLWRTYYMLFITPPMLRGLRMTEWRAQELLRSGEAGPDDPDWHWLVEYGLGHLRALEVPAVLASEGIDVRRLARYLRHHPYSWWLIRERMHPRLPGERLDRALDRLRRLGYLSSQHREIALIR